MIDRWIEPEEEEELFETPEDDDSDDMSPDMLAEAEYDYECRVFREGRFA